MENEEIKTTENNDAKVLTCPECGEPLMYLMPDAYMLYCPKCDKYFKNENRTVGDETTEEPYPDKNADY